ncbi:MULTISPECIES: TetR/AcrR family transcriptional regulator [Pseudomonas]|jgi:AcrR family transcriptional regulator|uniref:TetR/AcrR family transcriptional regulator n=1 Tax=Pseudomonas TaxID=286 RepID=UPI000876FDE7|nr:MULTISPECIES: TetR/AcrR family transcriptional regulator [Pseudomonas]MDB6446895.1 TetR/AcrR family transcriptional regulator [Pseudomonas sp. 21TX0197]MDT8908079.1 TetR/AcrR family transcriptional regulator [Pseudomonas prosekii]NHN70799.1 TetR/AcrR family transcriptional regulator [Pseudomonas fluorescens]ROO39616.1 TetR family transcriptional regulator [Pseudomonas sp. 7SR1]ROO40104.1 TetR family transcriptional regulator [Pseudomonas sp. AF76]
MHSNDLIERAFPGRRGELKRSILRQALACFNETGIEATNIETIRAKCETSVGAIYHHFGNKEGIVATLFFTALEDQGALRDSYLQKAQTAQEGVVALVHSYVEWVDEHPDMARFVFQSRFAVSSGPFQQQLLSRNKQRNKQLLEWINVEGRKEYFRHIPAELLPSLIIGAAENYSRAWLSGRVSKSPREYKDLLAEAACRAII